MRVRTATANDIAAMMAVECQSPTAAHWPEARYEAMLAGGHLALVIEESSVQGFVVGKGVRGEWEVENIAVSVSVQRQGLGTLLLREFLATAGKEDAKAVFLEVRESNQAARKFYEKFGFVLTGRRPRYYIDPQEDALLYQLTMA